MEANWSSYLSNMNALDFAHTLGGTRVNPLNAEQVKTVEAKLALFTLQAGPLAETIQRDPEAKRNLEAIFEKVVNERRLRVFYGFKAEDCNRMEYLITRLQSLFESAYPGLLKFKGVYSPPPKKAVEESPKLPPVALVDENLLKESLAYLSGLDDLKYSQKNLNPEDLTCIKNMLKKVCARLENYPANPIPDQILENVARLFQNVNEVLLSSEFWVFRLCVERDIAVPRQILHQMSTRCQYRPEIMNKIAQQLGSLSVSPNEFLTALRDFKPDFSSEASAKASMETIAMAFKTILSFPEKERSWVNRSLEALNHHLKKIPADACPEVQDFFHKDVPIKFLDKIVPCKLSDILRFCSSSPVLYLAWKKNLDNHTLGVNFDKFGITYDDYEVLKRDYNDRKDHLKNPFIGMALWHYLDVPELEEVYAEEAYRKGEHVHDICEAYRNGCIPNFAKFSSLGENISHSLAQKIATSKHSPAVLMECLLIGSKIANASDRYCVRRFVYHIFNQIPEILTTLRKAVEEQLFEDVKDCESCILQLVSLLESFEICFGLQYVEFIQKNIQIYQSLLLFDKVHPIPDILERHRKKLSHVMNAAYQEVFYKSIMKTLIDQSIPLLASVSDPWLFKHFAEVMLTRLRGISPEKLMRKRKYITCFETAIDFAIRSGCVKEVSQAFHPLFSQYVRRIWIDVLGTHKPESFRLYGHEIVQFQNKIEKIGKLQAATLSDEDEFVVLSPKLELDLRDCQFHREAFASIAAYLQVDKLILRKKGWFDEKGLNGAERDEIEKIFAKFPKGTIVWV